MFEFRPIHITMFISNHVFFKEYQTKLCSRIRLLYYLTVQPKSSYFKLTTELNYNLNFAAADPSHKKR